MASAISTMSLAAPSGLPADNKLTGLTSRSAQLSSLASISSSSFGGERRGMRLRRRSATPAVKAMAKELYFNKDGSAIKKLQVSLPDSCSYPSIG